MFGFFENKEIKLSEKFGDSYFKELESFLENEFNAKFIKKGNIGFELSFFEYSVKNKLVTIVSEGMVGTSLSGNKKIINEIIETISEKKTELLD